VADTPLTPDQIKAQSDAQLAQAEAQANAGLEQIKGKTQITVTQAKAQADTQLLHMQQQHALVLKKMEQDHEAALKQMELDQKQGFDHWEAELKYATAIQVATISASKSGDPEGEAAEKAASETLIKDLGTKLDDIATGHKEAMASLSDAHSNLMKAVSAPKRVIRGPDGRVASVEPITETMQ